MTFSSMDILGKKLPSYCSHIFEKILVFWGTKDRTLGFNRFNFVGLIILLIHLSNIKYPAFIFDQLGSKGEGELNQSPSQIYYTCDTIHSKEHACENN